VRGPVEPGGFACSAGLEEGLEEGRGALAFADGGGAALGGIATEATTVRWLALSS